MTDPSFYLRASQTGANVTGTPGHVLTFDASGERVIGAAPSSGGTVIEAFDVEADFDHETGVKKFVFTGLQGVTAGSLVWLSLAGPLSNTAEKVLLGGCYASNDEEVTAFVSYGGQLSNLQVPLRIFHIVTP